MPEKEVIENTEVAEKENEKATSPDGQANTEASASENVDDKVKDPEAKEGEKDPEAKEGEDLKEYAAFSLPEGMTFEGDVSEKFAKLALEKGLSQRDAQNFVDIASETVLSFVQKQADAKAKQQEDWQKEIKEDRDFGGAKIKATLSEAQKVISTYGSDGFVKFLNESGLGDNPEMIKTFARLYNVVGEAKFIEGARQRSVVENKTPAKVLYDD